jgi:hypothetical protein
LIIIGNHYQLYPQPHLPASDTFLWLSIWMRWLEVYHYARELEPDDCIFPSMGANGVVQPREQLSHDSVQKWINEATAGAGIRGSFSTHCFRRGGAQYQFMFAPVGERWTLAMVRWWGGWAENEQVSDLFLSFGHVSLHHTETLPICSGTPSSNTFSTSSILTRRITVTHSHPLHETRRRPCWEKPPLSNQLQWRTYVR